MTTTEELIAHPEQTVCGEDYGPPTVPWSREDVLTEVFDLTADEAWLVLADQSDPPTAVIESVSGVLWPTTDLDDTVVIEAAEEISALPLRRGRHRRPSLWQRAMAWLAARWAVLALLALTNTGTAILVAIAVRLNLRPLLALGAVVVAVAGLLFVWEAQHPRRTGGAR